MRYTQCLLVAMCFVASAPRADPKPPVREPPRNGKWVESLPPGAERKEWEAIQKRHPNADLPGWVALPGWGPPQGCVIDGRPRLGFARVCLENGALTTDWAQGYTTGKEGIETGPRVLPERVRQVPKLSPSEGWQRVFQAIRRDSRLLPKKVPEYTLRIIGEGTALRLVYEFHLPKYYRTVCTDALTGEVGHSDLTYYGVTLTPRDNPFEGLDSFEGRWAPTKPSGRSQ